LSTVVALPRPLTVAHDTTATFAPKRAVSDFVYVVVRNMAVCERIYGRRYPLQALFFEIVLTAVDTTHLRAFNIMGAHIKYFVSISNRSAKSEAKRRCAALRRAIRS